MVSVHRLVSLRLARLLLVHLEPPGNIFRFRDVTVT
jgi:hypothetical protein